MSLARRLVVAAAVMLVSSVGADVWAQSTRDPRAAKPYRGLFGGNNAPDENGQVLDLTLGLFGGYDDDIGGGQGTSASSSSAQASSKYLGGSTQLRYRRSALQRFGIEASGGTSSSLYTDIDNLVATSANAGLGLNWSINTRTRLSLSQSVAYSPFYSYAVFPTAGVEIPLVAPPQSFDTRVTKDENISLGSMVSFNRELSARAGFNASANYARLDFKSNADQRSGDNYGARAGVSYSLTRRARARLGYGYQTGNYGGTRAAGLASHSIDVGIDYARALSFSRKTQLAFSTGSTIYSDSRYTRYLVLGNAQLTHQLSRTWAANATYSRNLQLVNGFQDPFFSDAVAAGLGGYLGQRVLVQTTAGLTWGQLGLSTNNADNRQTQTTYVTPSLQVGITEFMALQASYFYYRYQFDQGAAELPVGFQDRRSRQGFRVGLSVWLPLVR